jgi:hypothetical protein
MVEPDRMTVELVLAAAADVVFNDGVSPAFMRQWVDETCFLLSRAPTHIALASSMGPHPRYAAIPHVVPQETNWPARRARR